MPANLSDYTLVDGRITVGLDDGLTPEQVTELLEAQKALPAADRAPQAAMVLLHCYQATHGAGCALSKLRVGPIGDLTRDHTMLKIYRKLTGDVDNSDKTLCSKARVYARRRVSGGETPSPEMRRSFATLMLNERQALGHTPATDRLTMEVRCLDHRECAVGITLTAKNNMDVKGLAIGDTVLVKAMAPDGVNRWFQARIFVFRFRCFLPPIGIKWVATEDGDTSPWMLPGEESACFKSQIKPLKAAKAA